VDVVALLLAPEFVSVTDGIMVVVCRVIRLPTLQGVIRVHVFLVAISIIAICHVDKELGSWVRGVSCWGNGDRGGWSLGKGLVGIGG